MRREKGLTLYVARPNYGTDCTAGGVSSKFDRLTLIGWVDETDRDANNRPVTHPMPDHAQLFEPRADAPGVLLKVRQFGRERILSIVPVDEEAAALVEAPGWHMMGGNYASHSDSRISDLYEKVTGSRFYGAVAIHDRREP